MDKSLFKEFNKIYFDFLDFLKKYSNGDKMFNEFYRKSYIIKQTNIKLIIKIWYDNISSLYNKEIEEGNIDFFLNKNYNLEINKIKNYNNSYNINSYIDFFRKQYNILDDSIIQSFIHYVQHLNRLSLNYFKK